MEDEDEEEDVSSYWMNLRKKDITLTTKIFHIKVFITNKIIIIRCFTEEKTEGRRGRRRRRQLLDKLKEK